jgi:hypothetical protein
METKQQVLIDTFVDQIISIDGRRNYAFDQSKYKKDIKAFFKIGIDPNMFVNVNLRHRLITEYTTTETGRLPLLHTAVVQCNWTLVDALLEAGVSTDSLDDFSRTPIFYAKDYRHFPHTFEINSIFKHKPSLNIADYNGMTPLMFMLDNSDASSAGRIAMAEWLLDGRTLEEIGRPNEILHIVIENFNTHVYAKDDYFYRFKTEPSLVNIVRKIVGLGIDPTTYSDSFDCNLLEHVAAMIKHEEEAGRNVDGLKEIQEILQSAEKVVFKAQILAELNQARKQVA